MWVTQEGRDRAKLFKSVHREANKNETTWLWLSTGGSIGTHKPPHQRQPQTECRAPPSVSRPLVVLRDALRNISKGDMKPGSYLQESARFSSGLSLDKPQEDRDGILSQFCSEPMNIYNKF